MRILYVLIMALATMQVAYAQDRLDNWQWAEWEQTTKYLEDGDFESAIAICRLYPRNRGFAERLKQVQNLRQLYLQGEQQQRAGHYVEAVSIYKKHRSIKEIGSLMSFEKKIDECVAKINGSAAAKLKSLERQVLAAELSFRAQRKLDEQNSAGALKDFTQAKAVIENIQGNIKTQIERGLAATTQFIKWERDYEAAKSNSVSKERERDLLVELGYIPIVKIPTLNRRLATLIEEIEGKNSIEEAVRNCELERLIENLSVIQPTVNLEIADKRHQFKSIHYKIGVLKNDRRNDSTVLSAYRSLSALVTALPNEVQVGVKRCIEEDRISALKAFTEQATTEGDIRAADAYKRTLSGGDIATITDINRCQGMETFNSAIAKVKDLIGKCDGKGAQQLFSELEKIADCDEKRLVLRTNADLKKRVTELTAADRRYNTLLNQATSATSKGSYKEARAKYKQLSEIAVCDEAERDAEVKNGLAELTSLEGKHGFEIGLVAGIGANKPLYKVNSQSHAMDYGLTFGGGLQVAYVNPTSPADLVLGVEYLSTSYYSVDNGNYAVEKFTVNGINGSVAIKVSPFKKKKIRPYIKLGFEGTTPISTQYEKYSSLGAIGNDDQFRKFLPSVLGALGLEFKVGKTYLFLEAAGSAGVQSVFDRSQTNISGGANREVDARFQTANVRFGVKLF